MNFIFASILFFLLSGAILAENWKLQPLKYNNPGLIVDLGVGLWAWPLPMDYDGDGDFDLLLQHISRDQGVDTVVYGVPALTATSLVDAATEFRPIEGSLLLK